VVCTIHNTVSLHCVVCTIHNTVSLHCVVCTIHNTVSLHCVVCNICCVSWLYTLVCNNSYAATLYYVVWKGCSLIQSFAFWICHAVRALISAFYYIGTASVTPNMWYNYICVSIQVTFSTCISIRYIFFLIWCQFYVFGLSVWQLFQTLLTHPVVTKLRWRQCDTKIFLYTELPNLWGNLVPLLFLWLNLAKSKRS
jgi:hypothetical protein